MADIQKEHAVPGYDSEEIVDTETNRAASPASDIVKDWSEKEERAAKWK